VVVEAEGPAGEVTRGIRGAELPVRVDQTFEAALAHAQPAALAVVERLRRVAEPPDEIEVEFGIRLSAELGAFIAKTAGDANFSITLRWKREPPASV